MKVCRDAHIGGKLLHRGNGGVGGFLVGHGVNAGNLHGLANGPVALASHRLVVLQAGGQDDGAGHAVGGVIQSGQAVSHGVDNAQAHIGEAHAGNVLAQGHALPALGSVGHSAPQGLGDDLNGLQVEHIGQLPGALGDVALDGVGQGVHAGGGGKALRHGCHHVRVHNGHHGDVVGVHADKLPVLLHVGDDVVDGDLRGGAGGGGHSDDGQAGVLGGGGAFQRANVSVLRVGDDDADSLGGIHGGAAANGDDAVGPSLLAGLHAVLYILNGGVGLDLRIDLISDASLVQHVGDLLGDAKLQQVGVGADQGLFQSPGLHLSGNLLDGSLAVIGCLIQDKTVCHTATTSFRKIPVSAPKGAFLL